DRTVTGVQTCALPICLRDFRRRHRYLLGTHADAGVPLGCAVAAAARFADGARARRERSRLGVPVRARGPLGPTEPRGSAVISGQIGRASCREREYISE